MGWAACLGMHHESVIGLRPDDATMTEIKSMLASEFVTISLIVPGIAGRRLQTDAAPFFSLVQCGKVRDLKPPWGSAGNTAPVQPSFYCIFLTPKQSLKKKSEKVVPHDGTDADGRGQEGVQTVVGRAGASRGFAAPPVLPPHPDGL